MTRVSRHTVTAAMRLSGVQATDIGLHHPGTPEAVVAVTIGRSVIYLHTVQSAQRFADVWRDGLADALRLPQRQRLHADEPKAVGIEQPSLVVHVTGAPAGYIRFNRRYDKAPEHVTVNLDARLSFAVYDQVAFRCCAEVFTEAAEISRSALPTLAQRAQLLAARSAARALDPAGLGARDRELARAELAAMRAAAPPDHPAARAAAALNNPRPAPPSPRRPQSGTAAGAGVVRKVAGRADMVPTRQRGR